MEERQMLGDSVSKGGSPSWRLLRGMLGFAAAAFQIAGILLILWVATVGILVLNWWIAQIAALDPRGLYSFEEAASLSMGMMPLHAPILDTVEQVLKFLPVVTSESVGSQLLAVVFAGGSAFAIGDVWNHIKKWLA